MPSIPSFSVLKTVARELLTTERAARVPEPDLVMDDPDKVAAFNRAGNEDGVLAPIYLFHAAHVSEIVRPGDTVVDLGCGPANQLGLIARLNPEAHFIGIDLSEDMLARADANLSEQGLTNVELRKGDITCLDSLPDQSVDAVYSTVVLHHLPDTDHLERVFMETRRVLRKGGGVYLADFGHLKSDKSIETLAYQYADRQPELFTLDYLYSLRAAFDPEDFERFARRHLGGIASACTMAPIPYLVVVKSPPRRTLGLRQCEAIIDRYEALPPHQKGDVGDLTFFLRLGGLSTPVLARPRRRPGRATKAPVAQRWGRASGAHGHVRAHPDRKAEGGTALADRTVRVEEADAPVQERQAAL